MSVLEEEVTVRDSKGQKGDHPGEPLHIYAGDTIFVHTCAF